MSGRTLTLPRMLVFSGHPEIVDLFAKQVHYLAALLIVPPQKYKNQGMYVVLTP